METNKIDTQVDYRKMEQGDELIVSSFISDVFTQFVAPGYSKEGIEEFMKYIEPDALQSQLLDNSFAIIATVGPDIIGIIEIRNNNHVALFFVSGSFQRMGIGRALLQKAIDECSSNNLKMPKFTVNASPNSIAAYKKLGFKKTNEEQCINGIRFIPMVLRVKQKQRY